MTLVDRSVRRQFTAAMALAMALALLLSGTALAQSTSAAAAVVIDDSCNDVPDAGFPDVSDAIADEINCLAAYGITQGKADGTYDPNGNVRRWQMALFIYRLVSAADDQLAAVDLPDPSDQGFTDIDQLSQEAQDAVNVLAAIGVVLGTTTTTYSPFDNIRRDQMASFINRVQGYIQEQLGGDPDGFPSNSLPFPDVSDSNVHRDNISGLYGVGIVQGFVDGSYGPGSNVTRRQMALFIMRHFEVNVDADVLTSLYPAAAGPLGDFIDAPELQTVAIDNTDEGDNEALLVFHFDEIVVNSGDPDPGLFHIVDPTGAVTNATSAGRDSDDLDQVNAIFPLDEVENATAAAVSYHAVTDVDDGLHSPEAAFPLQSVDIAPGDTTGPDLIGVENFDNSDDTVDFVFDDDVFNPGAADSSSFHLVQEGGVVLSGDVAAYSIDDDTVTVDFTGENITDDVAAETVRGYVEAGAVEDGDGDANLHRTVDVNNGGISDDPDLESFTVDPANDEATFVFDENVVGGDANVDETLFELQLLDGTTIAGDDFDSVSGDTVTIGFPGFGPSTVVAAFVDEDAVLASADGDGNEEDSGIRGLSFDAGDTLAPNLESARVNKKRNVSGDVTSVNLEFTFDDDVDGLTAGRFVAYDEDGTRIIADAVGGDNCTADDEIVECEVLSDFDLFEDTALAGIVNDAVDDADGFLSHPESATVN